MRANKRITGSGAGGARWDRAKKAWSLVFLLFLLAGAWGEDRLDVTDQGYFLPGNPPTLVPGPYFATWVAYHDGLRISEPDFYRILGRDEMAKEAESWSGTKAWLGWGGLAIIGAGLATGLTTGFVAGQKAGDMPFYTSLASISVGGGLWIAYLAMGFNFRPFDEAQRMADDYNASHK